MPLWGNTDVAASSPIFAPVRIKQAPTRANANVLFGNTTVRTTSPKTTIGVFGVDTTEIAVTNSSITQISVVFPGSGYSANAVVTVGGNGTANALANSIGKIAAVNLTAPGNTYTVAPPVTIAAPTGLTFNALTAVSNTQDTITLATNPFIVGDFLTYTVATGNTVVTGLANNGTYRVNFSNTTVIALTNPLTGANIDITATITETGHTLTGQTATALAALSGQGHAPAHAGWVLRTVGTGGRAGRVTYETLVAFGMSPASDAEDTVFKDV